MVPTIYLIRHAEGYHNLSAENSVLPDPGLTPLGEMQCEEIRRKFLLHDQITHLVASPMRRTLYTCLKSFSPAVKRGVRPIALPDAQEGSTNLCNIGSSPADIQKEFGDDVDLRLVHERWNDRSPASKYEVTTEKLEARARHVRLFLRDLMKQDGASAQIVLVTHGRILHFITEDWSDKPANKCT